LNKLLNTIYDKEKKAFDMYLAGKVNENIYDDIMLTIHNDKSMWEREIAKLEYEITQYRMSSNEKGEKPKVTQRKLAMMEDEDRKKLIDELIKEVQATKNADGSFDIKIIPNDVRLAATYNELFLNPDVKTKIKTNWQPELVTEPHLIVHYAYNRRMKKLFCEFTFDYILIKVLKSANLYNKFVETICNRINANYRIEFSRDYLELMRPKKLAPSNCYVSDMLSINTISIWKSLNGHYEFLNDKAEVDIDKTNYKISKTFQEYSSDILRFNAEVSRINRNVSIGNYDKLRAFELYKEFYNEEFGYPLRQLESARFDNAEETSSGESIMFVDETYFYINILHFTDNLYKDEEEETETE
jgi:hypothetical protein